MPKKINPICQQKSIQSNKNQQNKSDDSVASTRPESTLANRENTTSVMKRHGERSTSAVRGHTIHRSKSRLALSMPRAEMQEGAEKKRRKLMKPLEQQARKGEGDRHVPDFKPKHLYSGKRGRGKTDRR